MLVKRIICKIKKAQFVKRFKSFDVSSGFGPMGFGDTCGVSGSEHVSVGAQTWFGHHCEIIAQDHHFKQLFTPHLIIGSNVHVTSRLRLTCADMIRIDDDVLIAPDVFITDNNHGMDPTFGGGYSSQEMTTAPVHICQGVWLGQRVCVLPGVEIGEHSIVGAGSVVSKSIPPYSIAVGSPAKVVKQWDFNKNAWVHV